MNQTDIVKATESKKLYKLISADDGANVLHEFNPNRPWIDTPAEVRRDYAFTMAATRRREQYSSVELSLLNLLADRHEATFDEMYSALLASMTDKYTPAEGVSAPLIIRHVIDRREQLNGKTRRFTYNEMRKHCNIHGLTNDDFQIDRKNTDINGNPTWLLRMFND